MDSVTTGARWPNFRPNNSKEAPKNCQWPEKLEAVKWQNLAKVAEKRPENVFSLQIFRQKTI
jgi:hypothetical protein